MTKEELMRALEPLTDETEIMIAVHHMDRLRYYEIDAAEYALTHLDFGCIVLTQGAQAVIRRPARKPTP